MIVVLFIAVCFIYHDDNSYNPINNNRLKFQFVFEFWNSFRIQFLIFKLKYKKEKQYDSVDTTYRESVKAEKSLDLMEGMG